MGPDMGGHVGGLGRSCILPHFSPNGLLGGTSPEELGGNTTPHLPTWVLIQKHFNVHLPFHLADGPALPPCLLLGGEGLLSFIPIPQLQQTMITKENNGNITLFRINNTTDMMQQQ